MLSIKPWILASRPKTLLASLAPIILGAALALKTGIPLHIPTLIFIILGATSIQIGTNFANDYFDFIQGADTANRKGPQRAVQSNLISASGMKKGTIFIFIIAALASLYLIYRGGAIVLGVAITSIISGIMYTATPYSLAYLGIADIFAFLFFGPIPVGITVYLLTLNLSVFPFIIGCIPGFFSMAILSVNNLRDIEEDRIANKKTLAVRFGKQTVQAEYILCHVLSYSLILRNIFIEKLPVATLGCLLFIPFSLLLCRDIFIRKAENLNQTLGKTALFMFCFTSLLSILLY